MVLTIKRTNRFKRYEKLVTRTKKYLVSDEDNRFRVDSKVLTKNYSPISKHKSWFIVKMV
ncbi:30S ribosomal protein S17 [Candidatus Hodgkinia cicadicola]|uniref:30S ribosomal protein S17 n=1 Tax=Candidatus Hodgkinia cicadicola TaxID=573658 RepID=A0ABX4MF58_9HYPH|nr:30S ribosomal protein S17 [Candidatus Hodgkinia cicadicola]PIM96881.1 30S ribosomal protein S17 [Candidatus Hodgkinia cicadicola]